MSAILQTRRLSKAFGGLLAVNALDLAVEAGQVYGVIGPNGSGKTTLLNMVSGLYTPTSGTITYLEQRIDGLPPHRLVHLGIARTFQNIRLFPRLSVLDNVMVGQYCRTGAGLWQVLLHTPAMQREEAAIREKAVRVLEFVGLGARLRGLPGDLPYGQQRLIELARAMATEPRLLLLDEPAAGMTLAERRRLVEVVREIRTSHAMAMIVIEHDMRVIARLCDRVTVLNFGVKIAEGPLEQIRADPAVAEAYLGRRHSRAEAG
ncbi:MAG: ABC transporter ATP-binding protein [Chloroflexi bacterium]|nr:ABC transporter ATP-binding protein [Chloroflexota bacterium]